MKQIHIDYQPGQVSVFQLQEIYSLFEYKMEI